VARASFSVALVIAGSVIAVLCVAHRHGRSNGAAHANVISAASPVASIIVTGNVPIAAVWHNDQRLKHYLPTRHPLHASLPLTKKT
jgi:hypothetical protein